MASILAWLNLKRASSAACVAELLEALDHERTQRDASGRSAAADLLEPLLQFARKDEKTWAALAPDEFEAHPGGESYRGRTDRARHAVEAERLAVEALRQINWSEDYKKVEVLLEQRAWAEAHRLLAKARTTAGDLLLGDKADVVPYLWFAWRAQRRRGEWKQTVQEHGEQAPHHLLARHRALPEGASEPVPSMSMPEDLWIRAVDHQPRRLRPRSAPYVVGRAAPSDLVYSKIRGLSRRHLSLETAGGQWVVRDLGSRNGTFVNGVRVTEARVIGPGDRVTASGLTISAGNTVSSETPDTLVFVEGQTPPDASATVTVTLDGLLNENPPLGSPAHMSALIRAGRELCGRMPLSNLFELIIDLSMSAVAASRGALLILEDGELELRAARGGGFVISTAVLDMVMKEKQSLLVRDALVYPPLDVRDSILMNQIRSILAVPLQTDTKVMGLIYLDAVQVVRDFTEADLNLLTVLANVAAVRIENERLTEVEQTNKLLEKDLERAAEIQQRLLPRSAPAVRGYDLAGRNIACRTVGGDYYSFLTYPDGRVAMLVADVQGKGLPAALLMSSLHAWVQVLFEECTDLAARVLRLSRLVHATSDRLISFFVGVLDPASGELTYCNAGHNAPLLIRAAGDVERLDSTGRVMGILPPSEYSCGTRALRAGDFAVLYSDGVTEAERRGSSEQFEEERLGETVKACRTRPASEMIDVIIQKLTAFRRGAPQADDVTIVLVKCE